jgi:spore germination protein YaaH
MWKKILLLSLIGVLGLLFFLNQNKKEANSRNPGGFFSNKKISPTPRPLKKTNSIFVPYWASMDASDRDDYDRYIYFGVTANERGINTDDPGYKALSSFVPFAEGKEKWLTVRMLDHDVNTRILENSSSWVNIAHDIATTAAENGFDGVVLDLEVGLISFHIAPDSISGFSEAVSHEVHAQNMQYGMAIYGDASFRQRPYDVKTLSENTDEIMIMAYDFHKSFGEAGPNFPLNGVDTYNYDFTTMIEDFSSAVPAHKLSVIYGMYGYEWIVDDQGRAIKTASALTVNQIEKRFLNGCSERECSIKRDQESAETEIIFKDSEGRKHVVWFEDAESVKRKQAAAAAKGIGPSIFWAYGYF